MAVGEGMIPESHQVCPGAQGPPPPPQLFLMLPAARVGEVGRGVAWLSQEMGVFEACSLGRLGTPKAANKP